MPYYPDFGEQLYSWIETDSPVQYRDQEIQTYQPSLQDRELDIISPEHDSVDVSPPEPVPAPVTEVTEPRIEIPCTTEEPVEI